MPLSKNIIRVPVKLIDGQWEFLYGGPVKVSDGAFGELHIDRMHFADKTFLQALTKKRRVPALPVGTELRMALTIKRELDPGLKRYLLDYGATPHEHTAKISAATRFVPVYLVGPTDAQRERNIEFGGLSLCLEGMEPRGIESGMVELPKTHGMDYADSLNYAFTRLSEVFEPWRKAHTGNIYERVFFQERNGLWYPLDQLRDLALASGERELIAELRANVAAELGISWL
jgi:hypothetical protein